MADPGSYGQFCPVAMAAEIICTRWTALVLRELLCGSRKFNDIRRGVPLMSPSLLSKRLSELVRAGIVERGKDGSYQLSPSGEELRPVVMEMGKWGQRWVESSLSLKNLDPALLMWDMRRNLNPVPLPAGRCTIQFHYPELPEAQQRYWLVVENGKVDVCSVDPGHEVDLYITVPLRTMTAIWMGLTDIDKEISAGTLEAVGNRQLATSMRAWLGLSVFARIERHQAA